MCGQTHGSRTMKSSFQCSMQVLHFFLYLNSRGQAEAAGVLGKAHEHSCTTCLRFRGKPLHASVRGWNI